MAVHHLSPEVTANAPAALEALASVVESAARSQVFWGVLVQTSDGGSTPPHHCIPTQTWEETNMDIYPLSTALRYTGVCFEKILFLITTSKIKR